MISENEPSWHIIGKTCSAEAAENSCVDWAAILAVGILALAISFLLVSFGASLGLSLASPFRDEGVLTAWLAVAAGIWMASVMVVRFGAGGCLCGRRRHRAGDVTAHKVDASDGVRDRLTWAAGALVRTVLAAFGAGSSPRFLAHRSLSS